MRILIAGVGDVGYHLAGQLSGQHHITVIDPDEDKLERVDTAAEVLTIAGSATSPTALAQARVADADLFLAVTSVEEVNITAAVLAKQMGAKQTLARVSTGEFVSEDCRVDFGAIGIDHLIYPEELAAREIVNLIKRAAATDIHEFEDGKLTLIGLRLDKEAPLMKRTLIEIMMEFAEFPFRIVLVKRGSRTYIPDREEKFCEGDQIIVMTKPEGLPHVLKLAGKEKTVFKNIMILGGGKIGRSCVRFLENSYNVKMLESDPQKALELADQFREALIINGDGRDMELLEEEGVAEMDAFVAVTEDAETNIISCLLAREIGVRKTLAYVENMEYSQLTRAIGIDVLINKKLIAANEITRFVRRSEIVALTSIQGLDAEVLEFIVPPGARLTKAPLKDLNFPPGVILGGVIRGSEASIAVGNTKIEPNDRVVVFVLPGRIAATEDLLRGH